MLVGKLGFPHQITDEDGHVYTHIGYEVTICSLCGSPVTHSKDVPVSYCGWDKCLKREKEFKGMTNA